MDGEISATLSPSECSVFSIPKYYGATILLVVTDKMAAASDDCNYAAYIYQELDLSQSLSPSVAIMCHIAIN